METKVISVRMAALLGVIIFLVQLLFTQWTVKAASSREIIDYISFSGTLVSMLLAVLAIVYSYYTTASQKSDADRIATQIGALSETVKTLGVSESRLSNELIRLTEVSSKLDDVSREVRRGSEASEEMKTVLEAMRKGEGIGEREKAAAAREAGRISSDDDDQLDVSFSRRLARGATPEQCLLFYAAYRDIVDKNQTRDTVSKYFEPFVLESMSSRFALDAAYGEIFGYIMVLLDLSVSEDSQSGKEFRRHLADRIEEVVVEWEQSLDRSRYSPVLNWEILTPYLKDRVAELREQA